MFSLPLATYWHRLIFTALQDFPGSSSYPFFDSYNREASRLNRFSVAPPASAYLVHRLLCNCYDFVKEFLFICTLRLCRRLFAIEIYSYQDFFFYFINNGISRHKLKLSCSQCQRKQYNRHLQ